MDESTKGGSPVFEKSGHHRNKPGNCFKYVNAPVVPACFPWQQATWAPVMFSEPSKRGWGHMGLRIPNGVPTSNHVFRVRKTMVVGSLVKARHLPLWYGPHQRYPKARKKKLQSKNWCSLYRPYYIVEGFFFKKFRLGICCVCANSSVVDEGWGERTCTLVAWRQRVQASTKERVYGLVRPNRGWWGSSFEKTLGCKHGKVDNSWSLLSVKWPWLKTIH